jgi:hypothetical protein
MRSKVPGPFPVSKNDGNAALGDARAPVKRLSRPEKKGTPPSRGGVSKQMNRALRHVESKPDEFLGAAAQATLMRTTW